MTDPFGRTIDYLRLSVTDLCNLRCAYCMPPEGVCKRSHGDVCALEELEELAAACVVLGVKKIRLTGGEPLVRKGILTLVGRLNALRPLGLEELCMTTNGSLLADYAASLRAAGLDRLNISLDTLRPDRFRALTRGGDLTRVLDGIAAAEAAGFAHISLNVVLMRGFNEDEIANLALLAREKPCSVRFIELMPIGPGAAMREAYLPAGRVLELLPELHAQASVAAHTSAPRNAPVDGMQNAECRMQNDQAGSEFRVQSSEAVGAHCVRPLNTRPGVARLYTAPGWAGTVGLITPMSCDFCAQCSRIRITADGRLKPCLHAPEEIPLRGLHGEDLTRAIQAAAQRKPARHSLSDGVQSNSIRPMNEIGG